MTTEAKAPDLIRQACEQFVRDHFGKNICVPLDDDAYAFVMQQRAAARAEAFEEAACQLESLAEYLECETYSGWSGEGPFSQIKVLYEQGAKIRERAAQEANHDQ